MLGELHKTWNLLSRELVHYFGISPTNTLAGSAKSIATLETAIIYNPGYNWYIGLNPARHWGCPPKARSRDIVRWEWALIDVDPVGPGADPEACLNEILDTHGLRPYTAIVDSGRGRQGWTSLRPTLLTPDLRRQAERSTSAWLRHLDPFKFGCRVDTSCSDLARVARCPGTVNLKTQRLSSLISMPEDQLDPQVILSHFTPEPAHEPQKISGAISLNLLLPRLTEVAARFLTEGIITPGRHSACYATARSLAEAGVPISEGLQLLLNGGDLCSPALPRREVIRTLNQAYEKESNGRDA